MLIAGAFVAIAVAESKRPLRRRRETKSTRFARNLTLAGVTAAAVNALQASFVAPLVRRVEKEKLGLLNAFALPAPVRVAAGVLLLDYTLWWWHFANHKMPFFWRFHLVHHTDRDLDTSTALRFHFGEMSLSVAFRLLQVRLLGVDRSAMSIWQTLLFFSIFFHHSNLRLPAGVERRLVRIIVTPRMHGIHHSDYLDETDSNWASLLTWWDMLHGTMRLDVPQAAIEIGVPAYQREEDVAIDKLLVLPFVEQRDDWKNGEGVLQLKRADDSSVPGAVESMATRWQT
jgi:sterol desaturase/sphingolipid hydroxylase (fatty acid hydroxylase superfamily)